MIMTGKPATRPEPGKRDLCIGDNCAINRTDTSAEPEADQENNGSRERTNAGKNGICIIGGLNECRSDAGNQARRCTDGQVNAFGQDGEHNAKCHDALNRFAGKQGQQVGDGKEARLGNAHNDDQCDQYQPDRVLRKEFLAVKCLVHVLPLFLSFPQRDGKAPRWWRISESVRMKNPCGPQRPSSDLHA